MRARPLAAAALLALALPLAGCVTYPPGWDAARQGPDPYEGANRAIFGFNDGVDRFVLGPIARGWKAVTFDGMRHSIDHFFRNLGFPVRVVASLGQGKVAGAGSELARFATNTTIGVLGLFDPATRLGLEPSDEDFGQMFGAWGIPAGPYWVVPLLGPSDPRDFVGGIFDLTLDLGNAFGIAGVPGIAAIDIVNRRAIADEEIRRLRESSLDYYVAVRDGYRQRREALVEDRAPRGDVEHEEAPPDSFYELEDGGTR